MKELEKLTKQELISKFRKLFKAFNSYLQENCDYYASCMREENENAKPTLNKYTHLKSLLGENVHIQEYFHWLYQKIVVEGGEVD